MISAILAAAVLLTDATAALQAPADAAAKPAATAQAASPGAATDGKKQNDPTALVCKSEAVLGSRLPIKRCRTQGQIDAQRLEDRQALERTQIRTEGRTP